MADLLSLAKLIVAVSVGVAVGYYLRGRGRLNLGKAFSGSILLLIFSLGFS
ncbi:hypothetical protein H5T51_04430, partial [Candidatus Bathyarchaeota archaeon]|nr:hypothetical protein [Candidatus Bathyarchaeota archaeon]